MHILEDPQIKLTVKAVKPLFLLSGALAFTVVSFGAGWFAHQSPAQTSPGAAEVPAPVPVKTATVKRVAGAATRTLTGNLEAEKSVTLTSRVAGVVRSLTVREGDRAAAGQVLVRIDVNDILARRNQAEAGVNAARSGQLTAQAQTQQALAQLVEARAQLVDALREQRRMSMLQSEGAVSQSMLDAANTKVDVLEAKIGQSQAAIAQARAQVAQAAALVREAQAAAKETLANLNYGTVVAPFAGTISRKFTEIGSMAGTGEPLLKLESTDQLRLSVSAPESLVARFRPGQKVSVRVDALGRQLPGVVSQVVTSADPQSRNFTVKIALSKTEEAIPGMFGRVQIQASDRKILVVPVAALRERLGVSGVYEVIGNEAHFRALTLGQTREDMQEVFSGLGEGSRVILAPDPDLAEGTRVSVR